MYPYSEGDRLSDRNTYFYTAFEGEVFLPAWADSRRIARLHWAASEDATEAGSAAFSLAPAAASRLQTTASPPHTGEVDTDATLQHVLAGFRSAGDLAVDAAESHEWIHLLIQRFEVSKRIHARYVWKPAGLRALSGADYLSLERYVLFAECLVAAAGAMPTLQPLNALLKVMDTLVAMRGRTPAGVFTRCVDLIDAESRLVGELGQRTGVAW
jgi:hypothetical protein